MAHQSAAHRVPRNRDPKGTGAPCALRSGSANPPQSGQRQQGCLHKGKVGFEVLPLLSVPQVNPASEREWQKPSCPTAGFQHPKTWGIS